MKNNAKLATLGGSLAAIAGAALAFQTPSHATPSKPGRWKPKSLQQPNIVVQDCRHERALLSADWMPGRTRQVYAMLACSDPNARVVSGGCMLQFHHRKKEANWAISGSYPFEGGDFLDTPDSGEEFWELDNASGWVCTASKEVDFHDEPAKIAVSALCCR